MGRTFLNTWRIPNDTREPSDELESLSAMQRFYTVWFGESPGDSEATIEPELVLQLRTDLRRMLGTVDGPVLGEWLTRQPVHVTLSQDAQSISPLVCRPAEVRGCLLCAEVVALVVEAIAQNTWTRLKACPDCQWVFYDHTRNGNKVWCHMVAGGPQGRSCGSISKVRRWRERQRAEAKGDST